MSLEAFARAAVEHQWCPHEPTAKQRAFLAVEADEALFGGAAGGGKSDALLMAALEHVDHPSYAAILFRRTYTDLALPGAIMDRAHEWLAPTAAKWGDREKRWTFPSGATLTFGYLDGPRDRYRYQSAEFQFVGFDELTQFPERDYVYLFSRLRRGVTTRVPLRMRSATNPGDIGHEWVKSRFLDEPEGRVFVAAKLDDNPYLDRAEYERALGKLDPVTRQQLRDGVWLRDPSGLVYSSLDPERNVADDLPRLPQGETWTRVFAADFGVRDPTAFVVWYFTAHDPVAYLVASEQWSERSPSESAEKFLEWRDAHGPFERVVGDLGGLGKGFEAEWKRRYGLPLEPAEKSNKLGFIKLMNGELASGRIKILRSNVQYLRDACALAWASESQDREHPAMANHLPDAALYGWRCCRAFQATTRPAKLSEPDAIVADIAAHKERLIARLRAEEEERTILDTLLEGDDEWTE